MATYVCKVCGYRAESLPDRCPVCKCPAANFETHSVITGEILEHPTPMDWKGHAVADGMSCQELEDYLRVIVELEKDLFLQYGICNTLKNKLRPYVIVEPPVPVKPDPLKLSSGKPIKTFMERIFLVLTGLGTGAGTWFVLLLVGYLLGSLFDWSDFIAYSYLVIISLIGIGMCISGILAVFEDVKQTHNKKHQQLSAYESAVRQREEVIRRELEKKQEWEESLTVIKQESEKMQRQFEQTKHTLMTLYSIDVISPQFRGFAPVCSLYEFFVNGECKTMGEAYGMLRQKIQYEQIIVRLDKILSELEQIKKNQFFLYSAIKDSNQRMSEMVTATEKMAESIKDSNALMAEYGQKITENSAITAYCAEQSAKELSFMNRMNQYEGNYGNSWYVK